MPLALATSRPLAGQDGEDEQPEPGVRRKRKIPLKKVVNFKLAVLAKIVANLILWFSKIERRRRKIPCDNCQQQKFVVAHSAFTRMTMP